MIVSTELTFPTDTDEDSPLVSVVMPCLNEEGAIGICIEKIQSTLAKANINGEIVVCDNGSTDNSVQIAESMGVRVVHQPLKGYGNAYIKGFASARGQYLIMGDADFRKILRTLGNEFYAQEENLNLLSEKDILGFLNPDIQVEKNILSYWV